MLLFKVPLQAKSSSDRFLFNYQKRVESAVAVENFVAVVCVLNPSLIVNNELVLISTRTQFGDTRSPDSGIVSLHGILAVIPLIKLARD